MAGVIVAGPDVLECPKCKVVQEVLGRASTHYECVECKLVFEVTDACKPKGAKVTTIVVIPRFLRADYAE